MMIASLAEPAMLLIVFTVALVAGSTQLSTVAAFMVRSNVGLRVSLGMALIALVIVAIAENARIPVDNPATHLELTMVHEAMVLEYSGRHLAMIEFAAALKLLLYISLIGCVFLPWGLARDGRRPDRSRCSALAALSASSWRSAASCWRCSRPRSPRCGSSACRTSSAIALMLGAARHAPPVRVAERLMARPRLRCRPSPGRRAGAGQLHDALPGPPLCAAERLRAARRRACRCRSPGRPTSRMRRISMSRPASPLCSRRSSSRWRCTGSCSASASTARSRRWSASA